MLYDHIHEATPDAIPGGASSNAVIADRYGLIMDYHINMKYHFNVAKQEFFFQARLSFLNNAPKIIKNSIPDYYGSNEYFDDRGINQKDIAAKYGLGYQKNRFSIMGEFIFLMKTLFIKGQTISFPILS